MLVIDKTTFISPNFNDRPKCTKPSAIVLHTTEGSWASDAKWLCSRESKVSCHYVIAPDGAVFQLVDDDKRAWHAGVGSYLGIADWNDISIGVEVSHRAGSPWPGPQLAVLRDLCLDLITKYDIRQSMIAAHRWIAPERRSDPTDFPDGALTAWIAGLYAVDFVKLWGTAAPYNPTWGIPLAYRDSYRRGVPLGKAVTGEFDIEGARCQAFERGYILWSVERGAEIKTWRA